MHTIITTRDIIIVCGRMSAALKLRKTLLSESEHFGSAEFVQSFRKSFGDRRYENHLREFTSYGLLLDALVKYWEWQTIWQRHVEM